jgi:hypothetical protein
MSEPSEDAESFAEYVRRLEERAAELRPVWAAELAQAAAEINAESGSRSPRRYTQLRHSA